MASDPEHRFSFGQISLLFSYVRKRASILLRPNFSRAVVLFMVRFSCPPSHCCAGPAVWFGAVVLIQAAEALSSGGGNAGGGDGDLTALDDLEYTTLARKTLGKHGPSVVDGSIVLECAGSVCSYVLLIGGLATSLIAEGTGGATYAWWQSFYFVTPVIFFVFVLPPCLVRHFSNLRCACVYFCICLSCSPCCPLVLEFVCSCHFCFVVVVVVVDDCRWQYHPRRRNDA